LQKDKSYAMVLMDANMPVMDGFEATKAIRANSNFDDIPVIGLSGDTAVDDIRKMQEAGMEECLAKPIVLNHLYDVLYKYTDESKSTQIKKDVVQVETPTKKAFSDKELDFYKGLDISANDANFYNEILNEFITNYSDSAQRIQELLQNGNLVHAQRKLLDIIGVTANIGANNLHDISQDLKTAIEEKNKEKIIDSFKKYKQHLSVLLKEIEEYKAK
jgi:CheY-like chemotaxis protein